MRANAPVVLLHAFPVDRRVWAPVAEELRSSGAQVVTPDFRGFGSDVRELSTKTSLDVLADDIAETIMRLGKPAVVGGLSLGGYVAMNLVRRHPDRVAALALVDTKANADDAAGVAGRIAFADRVDADGSGWVAEAMLPKLLGPTTRGHNADVVAAVSQMIDENNPSAIAWVQRAMAKRPDSLDVLRGFDGPVLGIVGSDDELSPPPDMSRIVAAAQRGSMATIPDVGHLSPMEAPSQVAAVFASWLRSI
ncbi:MAG: alpha/beta fold hydrolase [Actinobacteria bacterium]|nr:alpha/beta fold hydrolase [Actinomycetota bacterium]